MFLDVYNFAIQYKDYTVYTSINESPHAQATPILVFLTLYYF